MFKPKGPYCQSCGMPLSKDEKGGGTEADGRKSSQYCSHCYAGGRFTDPNMTAEQMVEKVQTKMKQMHIPGFLAKSFTVYQGYSNARTLGQTVKLFDRGPARV